MGMLPRFVKGMWLCMGWLRIVSIGDKLSKEAEGSNAARAVHIDKEEYGFVHVQDGIAQV